MEYLIIMYLKIIMIRLISRDDYVIRRLPHWLPLSRDEAVLSCFVIPERTGSYLRLPLERLLVPPELELRLLLLLLLLPLYDPPEEELRVGAE